MGELSKKLDDEIKMINSDITGGDQVIQEIQRVDNDLRKKAKFGREKLQTRETLEPNFAFLSERDSCSGRLAAMGIKRFTSQH